MSEDLVVYLGGENLHLDKAVDASIDRLRVLESSVARVSQVLDRAMQVDQANAERQRAVPPPRIPMGDEGPPGLASERNRMILARHAARLLPMQGMAGEVQFLMHSMRGFGIAVGGAVTAVFALGTAFVEMTQRAKESRQAWHDWTVEMAGASRQSGALATAQSPITDFGKEMSSAAVEAGVGWRKIVADNEHTHDELMNTWSGFFSGQRWAHFFERMIGTSEQDTSYGRQQRLLQERVEMMRRMEQIGEREKERGQRLQIFRNTEDRAAAEAQLRIGTLWEGPTKKRWALEQTIANDRRAMHREEEDRERAIQIRMMQAKQQALAGGGAAFFQEWPAIQAKMMQDQAFLQHDSQKKRESFDKEAALKRVALERDIGEEIRQEIISADIATIESTRLGFEKQLELIQYHGARKMEEYQRAGRSTVNLEREIQAQVVTAYRDRAIQISDMLQDMALRGSFATFEMTASMTEWVKLARHLTRDLGLSREEVERIGAAFHRSAVQTANKPLLDDMRTMQVEAARMRGQISLMQAEYLKLRLSNPEASPEVAWAAARMRMIQMMMQPINIGQFGEGYQVGAVNFAAMNPQREAQRNMMRGIEIGAVGEAGQVGAVDLSRLANTPTDLVVGTVEKSNDLLSSINQGIQQLLQKENLN